MKRISIILAVIMITMQFTNAQLPDKIQLNTEYTTTSGLKIKFTEINPKNVKAKDGNHVKVHYEGKLTNDTIFDSSLKRGTPFSFVLGAGQVIKGWDEGVAYLHKGDKAVLTIPPALGYGDREVGKIPANSILIFSIELVDITETPKPFETAGKDTVKLPDGLKYIIVSKGKGAKVDSGMNVTLHYTGYLEGGKIFDSSVERGEPITAPVGEGKMIKGWDEGFMQLHVGDKARLFVPYQLGLGEQGRGPIPAKANLTFDIEIISAQKSEAPQPFAVNGKDTVTTASGLKYIVVQMGNGVKPANGQTVKVNYTGYFLNGKIFDSSVEIGKPFSFTLGANQVIKGWDEGIALMRIGGKTRFIIPSTLAYGDKDVGPIPAKSTLIFDVELLEVK